MTPLILLTTMCLVTLVAVSGWYREMLRRGEIERRANQFRAFVLSTEANLLRRRQLRPKRSAAAIRGHKSRRKGSAWKTDPILRSVEMGS